MASELIIDYVGGQCPVQAEGTIAGKPFYFRARGCRWQFEVEDECGDPKWVYAERYSDDEFAAGWMSEEEARGFIEKAAKMYLKEIGDVGND